MLDIHWIRHHPQETQERLKTRGRGDEELVRRLLHRDEELRAIIHSVEELRAKRNQVSREIGFRRGKEEPSEDLLKEMRAVGRAIEEQERRRQQLETEVKDLLLLLPNLPHPSVPVGADAEANRTIRSWGIPREFSFPPKPHWEIGEIRGLFDLRAAVKLAGSGFALFRGEGARLQRALIRFMLDLHVREHGYTEIWPPFLVRGEVAVGSGHLPKFAEEMYHIPADDLYLLPTAELALANLHREEILRESSLPLRYVAYSPCFRREAGSAGKDTRGLLRLHQFEKVELVQITRPENSYEALEEIVHHAETVLQLLRIPYRVTLLSTGDMGFGAAKCYDLEVWAPGVGAWLEVSSCSNLEDFQARRMNLRCKPDPAGKLRYCHTLNGSGTALPRLMAALLENHQEQDGRVLLPEAFRAYYAKEFV
ncbi:seryl-tRNA synthetase [Methylacidimicrobium cyclopophantes]|uniref:Serine--tRNA ligase n=1 Tax=Methylacidimicrobium cyclopophantes TaxID=1041766 RepID=A0A5E6MEC7_9BACT|nr:serine--tRNA ligase [Methylacidimicrobium cyclopophantes]VVM07564.1 seryl-tRNA synthetase [Methylacidimicrobium cyclopophantes]